MKGERKGISVAPGSGAVALRIATVRGVFLLAAWLPAAAGILHGAASSLSPHI